MSEDAKCSVSHGSHTQVGRTNEQWWPKALNLEILHQLLIKTRVMNLN